MPFHEKSGLKYLTCGDLSDHGITHGFFTRRGGVSPKPWSSLNTGGTVGDELTNVRENKDCILGVLGAAEDDVFEVWQVHSDRVVITDRPRCGDPLQKADAILCNVPGITLFMRFADCVPILLYDPDQQVVGIVHAGWKGTASRIAGRAVERMQQHFSCNPSNITACIGPSICVDHYEVGQEVVEAFSLFTDNQLREIIHDRGGNLHLDLWTANRIALEEAGVVRVVVTGECTACNNDDWYSHRLEKGSTGRFAAVIGL